MIEERKDSFAGQIIGAVHSLLEQGIVDITATDIIIEGNITNKKGNLIKPRGISSTMKALGFGKGNPKKVDGKTKKCYPLDVDHLKNLFERYGYQVTKVTITMSNAEKINKQQDNQQKIEEIKIGGIHSNNGNLGNSVTDSPQETKVEIEELIEPHHITCFSCGKSPTTHYYKGKYFCCLGCLKSFRSQI